MKYLGTAILFFWLLLLAGSCRTSDNPKKKIARLEKEVYNDKFTFDEKGIRTAQDLFRTYIVFATTQPDNEETPGYLFRAADLSMNLNMPDTALKYYNEIIYKYPSFQKAPECLFMLGFIYENYKMDYGKATQVYKQFIQQYPTHQFADDAARCIENMGKSPEELIREFEKKNKGKAITDSTNI
jgi:TolA-binding protein